jgi:hypothetical protein
MDLYCNTNIQQLQLNLISNSLSTVKQYLCLLLLQQLHSSVSESYYS